MNRIALLDDGYLELVETWGSDERIVEAARMSTGKGFQGWGPNDCPDCGPLPSEEKIHLHGTPLGKEGCSTCRGKGYVAGDEKLLRFLSENHHDTPFEMGGMVIEVKAPIMVFREWHRHRTQSYNEMSARYTPLPDENYRPTIERLMVNSKSNKQAGTGKGADELTEGTAADWLKELDEAYAHVERVYQHGLQIGVPKELARLPVPVARYSRMRASANLRNWLGFLTLRMAPNAQWEIRQYANALHKVLSETFPRTLGLFDERRS